MASKKYKFIDPKTAEYYRKKGEENRKAEKNQSPSNVPVSVQQFAEKVQKIPLSDTQKRINRVKKVYFGEDATEKFFTKDGFDNKAKEIHENISKYYDADGFFDTSKWHEQGELESQKANINTMLQYIKSGKETYKNNPSALEALSNMEEYYKGLHKTFDLMKGEYGKYKNESHFNYSNMDYDSLQRQKRLQQIKKNTATNKEDRKNASREIAIIDEYTLNNSTIEQLKTEKRELEKSAYSEKNIKEYTSDGTIIKYDGRGQILDNNKAKYNRTRLERIDFAISEKEKEGKVLKGIEEYKLKPDFVKGAKYNSAINNETYRYVNDYDRVSKERASKNLEYADNYSNSGDPITAWIVNMRGVNGISDYKRYDLLTEDEKGVFNYKWHNESEESAIDFLDSLTSILNKRETEESIAKARDYAHEHPILGSIESIGTNIASGAGFVEDIFKRATGQEIDPYSYAHRPSHVTSAIRGQVLEDIDSDIGDFAYNVGMGICDLGAQILVSKGFGAAMGAVSKSATVAEKVTKISYQLIVSSSAGTSVIIDAKNRGLTDNEAIRLGTAAAIIEYFTEKVSIDRMLANPQTVLRSIGKNSIAEGSEEIASSILNVIADVIISQDRSQWETDIRQLMDEDGLSANQAFNKVFWETVKDAGYEGAVGALVGAVAGTSGAVRLSSYGKSIDSKTHTELVDIALSNPGTASYKMAERIVNKIDNGKNIANMTKASLAQTLIEDGLISAEEINKKAIRNRTVTWYEQQGRENPDAKWVDVRNMLEPTEMGVDTVEAYDAWVAGVNSAKETQNKSVKTASEQKNNTVDNSNGVEQPHDSEIHTPGMTAEHMSEHEQLVRGLTPNSEKSIEQKIEEASKAVNDTGVSILKDRSINSIMTKVGRSGSIAIETNKRSVINDLVSRGISEQEAEREFTADFAMYYNAGMSGISFDSVKGGNLSMAENSGVLYQFYSAGVNDAKQMRSVYYWGENSGLTSNSTYKKALRTGKISHKTGNMLDALGKLFGVQVTLAENIKNGGNASINLNTGDITISLSSDEPFTVAAMHEIIHNMRSADPEGYNKLAMLVFNAGKRANNIDPAFGKLFSEYGLTDEEGNIRELSAKDIENINEEFVCRAISYLTENTNLLENLTHTEKTVLQKLVDAIHSIIDKITAIMHNSKKLELNDYQLNGYSELRTELEKKAHTIENILKNSARKIESMHKNSGDMPSIDTDTDFDSIEGQYKATSNIRFSKSFNEYPYDMKKVLKEYINAVDDRILKKLREIKNNKHSKFERINLNNLRYREVARIKELLNIDLSEYIHAINSNAIIHIENRHGEQGQHDSTMSSPEDVARVEYILNNYDTLEILKDNGKTVFSSEFSGKDGKPSPLLIYSKKINGTYYAAVAAAENSYKKIWVVTAYMSKNKEGITQIPHDEISSFGFTSETVPASLPSAGIIPHPDTNVKTKSEKISDPGNQYMQNGGENSQGNENIKKSMPGHKITVGMADSERAEVLRNIKIVMPEYKGTDEEINAPEVLKLEAKCKSNANKVLKALGEKFGVFKAYSNDNVSLEFDYSKGSLKESVHKQGDISTDYYDFAKMLYVFDDVVKNAVPIEVHTDKYKGTPRENTNLRYDYVLLGAFKEGKYIVPVEFHLKEMKDIVGLNNKLYVSITLGKIKIEDEVMTAISDSQKNYQTKDVRSSSAISISYLIKKVNPQYGNFFKYIPSELLYDEQIRSKEIAIKDDKYRLGTMRGEDVSDMLKEAARAKGYTTDESWKMDHKAPNSQDGYSNSMDNIDKSYGADNSIYSPGAVYYYGEGRAYDKKAIQIIQAAKNNPDKMIKIYRAVPMNVKDSRVRNGDWVAIVKEYAEEHGNRVLDSNFRIIENTVPAKHLFSNGDSINEWGYDNGNYNEVYKNTENNVKSLDVTYSDGGELIPLSKRYNENNPDTRYSFSSSDTDADGFIPKSESRDELLKAFEEKYKREKARAEHFKAQLRLTPKYTPDKTELRAVVTEYYKDYDGIMSREEMTEEFRSLYKLRAEYAESPNDKLYAQLDRKVNALAAEITENTIMENADLASDYAAIKKELKGKKISILPSLKADLKSAGGYEYLRKHNFGRFTLTNVGTPIEVVWQQLNEQFGELFPEDIINPADQLIYISEMFDSMNAFENPYSIAKEEAMEFIKEEIMEGLSNVGEAKPTFADKKKTQIEKVKQDKREAIKRLRNEKKAQAAKIYEHQRKVAEESRNRKKERQAREQLLAMARRLKKMKTTPQNRAKINELIGDLDTVAISITGKSVQKLTELKDWYNNEIENNKDFIKDKRIEKKIQRLSEKHISDMDVQDVIDLTEVLSNIENEIYTHKRLIDSEERRDIHIMAAESDKNIRNSGGINNSVERFFDKWITVETLSPMRFVRRLTNWVDSDPVYKCFQKLSEGQRDMLDYQMRAEMQFKSFTNNATFMNEITGKNAKKITITVGGKEYAITPAMRIALFLHHKNAASQRHMANGGIKIPNWELYVKGQIEDAYAKGGLVRLKPSDIVKITNEMSTMERKYAQAIFNYFNLMSKTEINNVSLRLKGYELAQEDNYFPIDADDSFTKAEFESVKFDGTIEGMGYLKERINSSNPIYLRDAVSVLNQSIRMHSKYVGLAIPVRNFNKIWNATISTIDEKGNYIPYSSSVCNAVEYTWGVSSRAYIEKLMADIQGNGGSASNRLGRALGKIRSKYAGSVLTLNLSVALKQAASYPTAAAVLGWKPLMMAINDVGKVDLDLIGKYTPLQWYRGKGFSSTELGDIASRNKGIPPVLNWIQAFDLVTTRKLWKASEYYVKMHNNNLKVGTDEYYKAVAEIYNKTIEETQPNYTTMQRPQALRSDNDLQKQFVMFKTQTFQNGNILYEAFANQAAKKKQYKLNPTEENKEALKQSNVNLSRAVTSQMVQMSIIAALNFAWSLFRGKDDKYEDEEGEFTLTSFFKAFGLDMLSSLASNVLYGTEVYQAINAFVSDKKYYGLEAVSFDTITNFVESATEFENSVMKLISKQTDLSSFAYQVDSFADNASKLAGIPYENVMNLFKAVTFNVLKVKYGESLEKYYSLKLDKKMFIVSNSGKVTPQNEAYSILYKAYSTGNKDIYDTIVNDMVENGVEPSAIESKIKSKSKKDENFNFEKSLGAYGGVIEESGYESETKETYSIDNLSAQQYNRYRSDYLSTYGTLRSYFPDYKSNPAFGEKVLGYIDTYASETALKIASGGEYQIRSEWVEDAEAFENMEDVADYITYKAVKSISPSNEAAYDTIINTYDFSDNVFVATGDISLTNNKGEDSNFKKYIYQKYNTENYIKVKRYKGSAASEYDKNGKAIKGKSHRDKVINYIGSMPVSTAEKRALYLSVGYSEKTCPW